MTTTDETGFHRIYRTFQPELTAYFLRRVDPDDVQDLTEDVFTVAWRRRGGRPSEYLFRRSRLPLEWRR